MSNFNLAISVAELIDLLRSQDKDKNARAEARAEEFRLARAQLKKRMQEAKTLAYAAKRREDCRRNSARYREKQRVQSDREVAEIVAELNETLGAEVGLPVSHDLIRHEIAAFKAFLSKGGRSAGQLKPRRHEIMACRITLLEARAALGCDPSYGVFAERLAEKLGGEWKKDKVVAMFKRLKSLETPDGPWTTCFS